MFIELTSKFGVKLLMNTNDISALRSIVPEDSHWLHFKDIQECKTIIWTNLIGIQEGSLSDKVSRLWTTVVEDYETVKSLVLDTQKKEVELKGRFQRLGKDNEDTNSE